MNHIVLRRIDSEYRTSIDNEDEQMVSIKQFVLNWKVLGDKVTHKEILTKRRFKIKWIRKLNKISFDKKVVLY